MSALECLKCLECARVGRDDDGIEKIFQGAEYMALG